MASLVAGIVSARTCENTVRDSRIVTPEINIQIDYYQMVAVWQWLQFGLGNTVVAIINVLHVYCNCNQSCSYFFPHSSIN